MSNYIVLLDPSMMDNSGTPSYNLGDLIINESVMSVLSSILPGYEVVRLSTHNYITERERKIIRGAEISIVGGSNILSSDIKKAHRLTTEKRRLRYLFPQFDNVVLLGAGWADYSYCYNFYTSVFYNRIFKWGGIQSVRDSYSMRNLRNIYYSKVENTSCPTLWDIDVEFNNLYQNEFNKILFTLTDYDKNFAEDSKLIEIILETEVDEIYFFPQGSGDEVYLKSLLVYKKNSSRIKILKHDCSEFNDFVKNNKFNYIGTRLHGGIKCLQHNMPSLILSIDNRAMEISKDIGLNVVNRGDDYGIRGWISGENIFNKLNIPLDSIAKWKDQF